MSSVVVDLDERRTEYNQTGDLTWQVSFDSEPGDHGGLLISCKDDSDYKDFYDIKAPSEDGYLIIRKAGEEYKYLFGDILREAEENGKSPDEILSDIVNNIDDGNNPKDNLLHLLDDASNTRDDIAFFKQEIPNVQDAQRFQYEKHLRTAENTQRIQEGITGDLVIEYLESQGVSHEMAVEVEKYLRQAQPNDFLNASEQEMLDELESKIKNHVKGEDGFDAQSFNKAVKAIKTLVSTMQGDAQYSDIDTIPNLIEAQNELGDLQKDLYSSPTKGSDKIRMR